MSSRIDQLALAAGFTRLSLTASLLIVTAAVLTFLAAQRAQQVSGQLRAVVAPAAQADSRVKVRKRHFGARDYERAIAVLQRNHPDVSFEVSRGATQLIVSITQPARYDAWIYALNSLQGYGRDVGWEAESMCLGKCEQGRAGVATIRAFTQELEVR